MILFSVWLKSAFQHAGVGDEPVMERGVPVAAWLCQFAAGKTESQGASDSSHSTAQWRVYQLTAVTVKDFCNSNTAFVPTF
jgi:hypothetical protein